ncbi:hypothetical protein FRC11_001552 [Ceratobasidium sp. 423]|nr:hypothetical protein FRC11_001552 [Ceratobasidium sp. 423]
MIPLGNSTCPDLANLKQPFQGFSVDSEQNLVVLAVPQPMYFGSQRVSIQLRSMLDGMPHPLAHHPTLTILADFKVQRGATAIEFDIMDHLLVVKITDFGNHKYELVILDWRSGTLLQRIGSGSDRVARSFVYLDKGYILLASGTGFDRATISSLKFLIYNIYFKHRSSEDEAKTGPNYRLQDIAHSEPILIFEFPEIDDRYRLSPLLFIRAGPIPGSAIHTQSTAFTHSRVPTVALAFTFNGYSYFMSGLDFRVFIDASRLFHYILNSNESSSTVVPWSEWGTRATRWFSDSEGQGLQWDRMISGSRWLRTTDRREHKPPYGLSVFDFNPRTVMRHAQRKVDNYVIASECESYQRSIGGIVLQGDRLRECIAVRSDIRDWHIKDPNDRTASIEIVDSDMPTIITKGFKAPVESRLPYRVVSKFEDICCRDWTMDGEHIVGIHVSENSTRIVVYV